MREKHSKPMTLNVRLQRCLSACYIVQITHKESNFTNLKCERYEQRTKGVFLPKTREEQ